MWASNTNRRFDRQNSLYILIVNVTLLIHFVAGYPTGAKISHRCDRRSANFPGIQSENSWR